VQQLRVSRGDRKFTRLYDYITKPNLNQVWNPGFDVTPGELIDGLITEKGVCFKEQGKVLTSLGTH
jgi:methylthioribose-1-phosphate isomerase